jgi:hypothetical protein
MNKDKVAVEIDPSICESGRHLAAWAGLTPKERSTGGKQRMGGISRAGDERLRVLLVSGAIAVINAAMRPGSQQMTERLQALLLRKPRKLVSVALANKMACTAWAMMKRGEMYRRPSSAAGAVAAYGRRVGRREPAGQQADQGSSQVVVGHLKDPLQGLRLDPAEVCDQPLEHAVRYSRIVKASLIGPGPS